MIIVSVDLNDSDSFKKFNSTKLGKNSSDSFMPTYRRAERSFRFNGLINPLNCYLPECKTQHMASKNSLVIAPRELSEARSDD